MHLIRTSLLGLLSLLLVVGCGGSATLDNSGGGNPPVQTLTKEQVKSTLARAIQNGSEMNSSRDQGFRPKKKTRDHNEDHWFDEELQLWVTYVPGLADDDTLPSGYRFHVDEEGTVDAGHDFTWFNFPGDGPGLMKFEFTVTAGPHAGEYELTEIVFADGELSSGITSKAINPRVGTFEYEGTWESSGASHFEGKMTLLDGSWDEYVLDTRSDFSSTYTFTTSTGISGVLNFNEDYSGSGTISGDGDGLPADLTWDETGTGTLTWSDGTTESIQVEMFMRF